MQGRRSFTCAISQQHPAPLSGQANPGFKTYVAADATFAFAKADYNGIMRSAEDVHAMAMANLHGEYATVVTASELQNAL